jgi:ketosteroid isomerase-like protein
MKPLWATALVALGSCLMVNAQSGSTYKELIALEQSFNDALLRADWEAVERLCANDLVFTNAEGSVTNTSDHQIGSLKSGDVKFESLETSDVKVQDLGNVAVVTGKVVERGRYKTNDLSGTYRFTDVWAKRNGKWQLVVGQETRAKSASGSSVEQEITQLEKEFSEAEVQKDIQRMSKLMADDLTDVEDDGSTWTKSDIIKLFESPATMLKRDTISELKIRQYGDTAIVTLLDSADFTVNGRDMGGEFRLTDVWARHDGAWQLVAFHSSKIKKVPEASKGSIAEASSNATSRQEGKKQSHSSQGMKSESSDSVKLKQLEQDWLDSYREGDADKMGKILADDFIGRWANGSTQTKDEQLRAIRTGAEKHSTNQMLECNVRLYRDTAVVTGLQTEQSVLEGRDGSGTYSYTDVFVKRDGRWQVVASETKRVASQTGSRENVRDRVIGTWQLVSAGTFRRDGSFEPYPEYGSNARGYLMYDSTGHMCVSLANPNHPYWVNAEKPTDAEKVRSYDVFFAYCGTYEIREKESRIIHRPEMGSWPHYVGTDQNRNFRLEGNRLILSYQITWQRVSPPSYAACIGRSPHSDWHVQ